MISLSTGSQLWRCAAVAALAVLTACGSNSGSLPEGPAVVGPASGSNLALAANRRPAAAPLCGYSRIQKSRLYVANDGGGNILSFAPPSYGKPTVLAGVGNPVSVAFDTAKHMFVIEFYSNRVLEYNPPYTGQPIAATKVRLNEPYRVALDDQDRLYIADFGNNRVVVLDPPYTQASPSRVIDKGVKEPYGFAFDSDCNLWVTHAFASVDEYIPPYNGKPLTSISLPNAHQLTFDDKDDMFVGLATQSGSDSVIELPPPYNGKPIAKITRGIRTPLGLALDAHENLLVGNYEASTITEYVPPYSSGPSRTITSNLSLPADISFGPL